MRIPQHVSGGDGVNVQGPGQFAEMALVTARRPGRPTPEKRLADGGGGGDIRGLLPAEILSLAALLVLAGVVVRRLGFDSGPALLGLCALAVALGLAVANAPRTNAAQRGTPIRVERERGHASSAACRSCHPAEWQSWYSSFHRTMTEPANGDSVRAPWDVVLTSRGHTYVLARRGEEFWVTLPDPDRSAALARRGEPLDAAPAVERRVVMTTGSHHYQAYWVPGARGNELWQLPIVYHFESNRFIARHDAFLQPEQDPPYHARWNSNCIQCHSVAGEPRHELQSDRFDSRVVELGVACEACHGAGASHVAREKDPFVRLRQRGTAVDAGMVDPRQLDAERASEICGQCHSYFMPRDSEAWWTSGFADHYRPGDDLDASRRIIERAPGAVEEDPEIDESLDSLFYPDGTIRVGGREWNGLRASACFTRGRGERQLACTTCHQLHGGSRDDQLRAEGGSDAVCRGCHAGYGTAHSHHREGSSGNECMNCHMPRTTYALFKAIRSHRISKPTVDRRPGAALDACTLCHQDRSLDWASEQLAAWSTGAAASPAEPRATTGWSALATAVLSGDAAARVIAAFELGEAAARQVSGLGWQAQLLVEALDDPYAAVRFVAARSLRSFPGFEGFAFQFDAARERRLEQRAEGRRRAEAQALPMGPAREPLPRDARGLIPRAVIDGLVAARDERPIRIAE
jgi:predicted CXXCH cytochrome family protein